MSSSVTKELLAQLEQVLDQYKQVASKAQHDDLSGGTTTAEIQRVTALARAAVARIAGRRSVYMEQVDSALARTDSWDGEKLSMIAGVIESLKTDVTSGYLKTLEELIHGELFGDFLEMADHLLDAAYKDAAAVVGGSTLEGHLRQMCKLHSIVTEIASGGKTRPKKADAMNSDLAGAAAYSKLDQKSVTSWLDLRNKAAHGEYDKYTKEQVAIMLAGLRDFITRNPA